MSYPTVQEYHKALSLPAGMRPFRTPGSDPLRNGEFLKSPAAGIFMPLLWGAGSFAAVFCCLEPGGVRRAVRCILQEPNQEVLNRYAAIEAYHRSPPASSVAAYIVNATFVPDGLKVSGVWHSLFVMDWVEGVSLATYVRDCVTNRATTSLLAVADSWRTMVTALQASGVAHGDLNPSNVLITPKGELRLVDYDTMFVPGVSAQGAANFGTDGYVHPDHLNGKTIRHYDDKMDTFGALVVLLSLHALTWDPSLYGKFTGENLLFAAKDLANPTSSQVFRILSASPENTVSTLTRQLEALCQNVALCDTYLNYVLTAACGAAPASGVSPTTPIATHSSRIPLQATAGMSQVVSSLTSGSPLVTAPVVRSGSQSLLQTNALGRVSNNPHNLQFSKRGLLTSTIIIVAGCIAGVVAKVPHRSTTPASRAIASSVSSAASLEAKRVLNQVQARLIQLDDRQKGHLLSQSEAASERQTLRSNCETGLRYAEAAIRQNPTDRNAWVQQVAALYYLGRYKDADQKLREAAVLFPGNSDFEPLRALVTRALNRTHLR